MSERTRLAATATWVFAVALMVVGCSSSSNGATMQTAGEAVQTTAAASTRAAIAREQPSITLKRGASVPGGFWYDVTLNSFTPGLTVTVTCRDSVDPGGFWDQTFTINGGGSAADPTLCYSADGPDHWVTSEDPAAESNRMNW